MINVDDIDYDGGSIDDSINSDNIINPINFYDRDKIFLRFNFFYDIYRSRDRCVFYSIMIIGLIIVFSPLYFNDLNEFGFKDSIFLEETMKSESIKMAQFSMLTIILPMLFDTVLDFLDQSKTINFEIHERIMFMIITLVHAIVNITYYGTLKGAIFYIFVNQASVIIANCCIFSAFTKLERAKPKEMIPIIIGKILIITGATVKMYGFIHGDVMNIGIIISVIGNILLVLNCFFWILHILNITPTLNNVRRLVFFEWQKLSIVDLTDAENAVIVYFLIYVTWIFAVFISNSLTNSVSWKISSESNILSFEIFHICLVFVAVALPMRLTKKRQNTAFEAIIKLTKKLDNERMILTQVLPNEAVRAIQKGLKVSSKYFQSCTIFFSDIEGFTDISSQLNPNEVMYLLDELYSVMDYVTTVFKQNELLKIETIGDAYMLVSGISDDSVDHVRCITDYALIVRKLISLVLNPITQEPLRIRIGIHTGPVCAGVVGFLTPHWSLFGDTVNTAARMETNSIPGKINSSESTANFLLKHNIYNLTKRELINVKGKGEMQTYWVDDYKNSNYYIDSCRMDRLIEECKILIQKCKSNRKQNDDYSISVDPTSAKAKAYSDTENNF